MSQPYIKTIQLPVKELTYVHSKKENCITDYMMTYLTDDEFNTYSKTNSIAITRNGRTYVVNKNQILLGAKNLDLHTESDDYEKLKENQNLLEFAQSLDKGIYIHQNYDYDSNTCTTDINRIKDMESFDVPRIIQQHFGMLGKPSIVILFKQVHKCI